MKNRLTVAGATTLALLMSGAFRPALAEEAAQPAPQGFEFCSAGPGASGCVRFQGYIYVGRKPAGEPATAGAATAPANPALGDERLYIHVGGGADAR